MRKNTEYMLGLSATPDTEKRWTGTATIVKTYEGNAVRREVFTEEGESVAVFWGDNPALWCEKHGFKKVEYKFQK